MRLYEKPIDHTGEQTMLYLTCAMISNVELNLHATGYLVRRIGHLGIVIRHNLFSFIPQSTDTQSLARDTL